ncbi:Hypothetical predicted protein [Octopus vulgaris]|uniref:Stromal membrane-associated protein 1 n=1 Tax=Octopus vulgaris TaxID=6645 RepID=A0AA36FC86_OCTVU|nr:Hypothetical predicted protein [Octopus vulgaris]
MKLTFPIISEDRRQIPFIRAKYEHKRYIAREWVQPKPTVPKQLLDDEKPEKKKTRGRPSSMIQLNAPSQKVESKEVTETTAQPLKEIAKETKKSSHADDLLNLSSPGESSANNANLLDDFLGSSGTSTANAAPAAPINAVQSQTSGQTPTNTANSSQQAFQQNGAFDDSLFTSASSDAKSGNDKTTKESIMALYGSSTPQQQNIFGVPGGMYMPAQGINVQPTMPANNSMAVQQGMTGMVNPGIVGMPQAGLYQLNATGMMATAPGSNSMPAAAAAGMMMQPPQMGMYAATQAQPQMNQMNMQQMQHQLAAMRLNTSNVIPPTGQMGVRPPVGAPANQASNPWGMQPTSGQTLSTNLWQ